jgi:hypothetical protein
VPQKQPKDWQCIILHYNGSLHVFNLKTEKEKALNTLKNLNPGASNNTKYQMNMIMDGRLDEVFSIDSDLPNVPIGNITTYLGMFGDT